MRWRLNLAWMAATIAIVGIGSAQAGCNKLSVVFVENPRFSPISDADVERISRRIERETSRLLAKCVALDIAPRMSVADAFSHLDVEQRKTAEDLILRQPTSQDIDRFAAMMSQSLAKEPAGIPALARYVNSTGAVSLPMDATADDIARAAVTYHARTMGAYRSTRLADGSDLIDDSRFNEYMYWLMLPKTSLAYDVYLTNQPIVSMERHNPSLHASIRGGISNGVTVPCRACRYGTASIVSLYAIFAEDELVRSIRREPAYSADEKASFATQLVTHELGHLLLHLGHPYELPDCIMDPVERLDFRDRSRQLREGACGPERSAALKPGAAGFRVPLPSIE